MIITNHYQKGDLVTCSASFSDASYTPQDPSTVSFFVKDPNGAVTSYTYGIDAEILRDGIGLYHTDVGVQTTGAWYYRFVGIGALQVAEQRSFIVDPSQF